MQNTSSPPKTRLPTPSSPSTRSNQEKAAPRRSPPDSSVCPSATDQKRQILRVAISQRTKSTTHRAPKSAARPASNPPGSPTRATNPTSSTTAKPWHSPSGRPRRRRCSRRSGRSCCLSIRLHYLCLVHSLRLNEDDQLHRLASDLERIGPATSIQPQAKTITGTHLAIPPPHHHPSHQRRRRSTHSHPKFQPLHRTLNASDHPFELPD